MRTLYNGKQRRGRTGSLISSPLVFLALRTLYLVQNGKQTGAGTGSLISSPLVFLAMRTLYLVQNGKQTGAGTGYVVFLAVRSVYSTECTKSSTLII